MIESNRTGRGPKAVLLALLMLACVIAGASTAAEDTDAANRGSASSPLSSVSPEFETATYYAYVGASVSMYGSATYEGDVGYDVAWVLSVTGGYGLSRTAYTDPGETSIQWGNEDVGKVTGTITKAGTIYISWKTENDIADPDNPETETGTVTIIAVSNNISVTGIEIAPVKTSITVGESTRIDLDVSPGNASDQSVTWSVTSGSSYVTISGNDSYCTVTGKAAGTATIKCSANDGSGKYDTCTMTVQSADVKVTSISVSGSSTLAVGSSTNLSATVLPTNATDRTVTWSVSSGSAYASVDSSGTVTGKAAGTAVIKATANDGSGKYGMITVTVQSSSVMATFDAGEGNTITSDYSGSTDDDAITDTYIVGDTIDLSDYDADKHDSNGYSYVLSGWKCSNGTTYGTTGKVTITSNLTFTAQFFGTAKSYTVTLNANGGTFGSGSTRTVSVTYGSAYSALSNVTAPTKSSTSMESYSFAGWYTSASGGTLVTSSTVCSNASNHTLYAHWTSTSISVKATSVSISGSSGVRVGSSIALSATVLPTNATDRTVTWSVSSGSAYASVDSFGTVTGKAVGTAVIKATANDGSGKSATKTISVTASSVSFTIASGGNATIAWSSWGIDYSEGMNDPTFDVSLLSVYAPDGSTSSLFRNGLSVDSTTASGMTISCPVDMRPGKYTGTFDWSTEAGGEGYTDSLDVTLTVTNPSDGSSASSYLTSFDLMTMPLSAEGSFTRTLYIEIDSPVSWKLYRLNDGGATASATQGAGITASSSGTSTTISGTILGDCTMTVKYGSYTWSYILKVVDTTTRFAVTFKASSTAGGTVDPVSIDAREGSTITVDGSTLIIDGTEVIATPKDGYVFSGWSNASGTITGARTITASFTQVTGFSLSAASSTLIEGETLTVTSTPYPSDIRDSIQWSVDDGSVVSLSTTSGSSVTITALKGGSAVVTAKVAGLERTCKVTVKDLTVSFTEPSGDEICKETSDAVTFRWTTTAKSSPTVTVEGPQNGWGLEKYSSYAKVTFHNVGTYTVSITASSGDRTAEDSVTVDVTAKKYAYSVEYYDHGDRVDADGPVESSETVYTGFTVKAVSLSNRTNAVFKGWAESATADSVQHIAGGALSLKSTSPVLKLHAVWEYTASLTYDAIGGEPQPEKKTVRTTTAGDAPKVTIAIDRNEPSVSGYTFKGWSGLSGGSAAYRYGSDTLKTSIELDADAEKTLYAVYEKIVVTVLRYIADDAVNVPSQEKDEVTRTGDVVFTISSKVPVSSNGWTFLGWSLSSKDGKPEYGYQEDHQKTYMILTAGETAELYAVWALTITYDGNGGTPDRGSDIVLLGGSVYLPAATRETSVKDTEGGKDTTTYTFLGWSVLRNADKADAGLIAGALFTPNDNTSLYAVWDAKGDTESFVTTFDPNGGDGERFTISGVVEQLPPAEWAAEGPEPVEGGYRTVAHVLLGWSVDRSAVSPDEGLTAGARFVPTDSVTLYAVWKTETTTELYEVSFDLNGVEGSIDPLEGRCTLPSATRDDESGTIPNGRYVISYTFLGWSTAQRAEIPDEGCTAESEFVPVEDTLLYAVWKAETTDTFFTLTYGPNGASSEAVTDTFDARGAFRIIRDPGFVREGFMLLGWSVSEQGASSDYSAGAQIVLTEDTVLYAVWVQEGTETFTATLRYDATGGSGAPEDQTLDGTDTDDRRFAVSPIVPKRAGYGFEGWSVNADGSGDLLKGGDAVHVPYDGERTLYAVWKAVVETVTVSFYSDGGSGAEDVTVIKGGSVLLPGTSRDGHRFLGWYSGDVRVGGVGDRYMAASDITLKACWEAVGGDDTDDGPDVATGAVLLFAALLMLVVSFYTRFLYLGLGAVPFALLSALFLLGVL